MRSTLKLAVPIVVAALALGACGTKGGDTASGGSTSGTKCDLQIGFFGALTGDAANLGINIKNGADLAVAYDVCPPDFGNAPTMLNLHIQAMADAVLTIDGVAHRGVGVVEQLFIGPHAASGLSGLLDPAG